MGGGPCRDQASSAHFCISRLGAGFSRLHRTLLAAFLEFTNTPFKNQETGEDCQRKRTQSTDQFQRKTMSASASAYRRWMMNCFFLKHVPDSAAFTELCQRHSRKILVRIQRIQRITTIRRMRGRTPYCEHSFTSRTLKAGRLSCRTYQNRYQFSAPGFAGKDAPQNCQCWCRPMIRKIGDLGGCRSIRNAWRHTANAKRGKKCPECDPPSAIYIPRGDRAQTCTENIQRFRSLKRSGITVGSREVPPGACTKAIQQLSTSGSVSRKPILEIGK